MTTELTQALVSITDLNLSKVEDSLILSGSL